MKKMIARIMIISSMLGLTLLFKLKPFDWAGGRGGGGERKRKYGCWEGEIKDFSLLSTWSSSTHLIFLQNVGKFW